MAFKISCSVFCYIKVSHFNTVKSSDYFPMVCALVVVFKKFFHSYIEIMKILYLFSKKHFLITFKSSNNVEYIFVYGVTWRYNIILFHKSPEIGDWAPEYKTNCADNRLSADNRPSADNKVGGHQGHHLDTMPHHPTCAQDTQHQWSSLLTCRSVSAFYPYLEKVQLLERNALTCGQYLKHFN